MNLDEAIKVKGILVNPLEKTRDGDIPQNLGISLDDLDRTRKKYSYNDENGYITPGENVSYSPQGFDIATQHIRTIIFQQPKERGKRFDLGEKTLAVKGSGMEAWTTKKYPYFLNSAEEVRKYPILRNFNASLDTHRIWGGENEEFGRLQYLNALIILALAERSGVEPAIYFPRKMIKFRELPMLKSGKIENVSLEEYCHRTFQGESSHWQFEVPTLEQAEKFVEFFYEGKSIGLRIPPPTFKYFDERYYSAGWLHGLYSNEEVRKVIKAFSEGLAKNVKLVHDANGTFTEIIGDKYLSSLSTGNVSVGGTICDLDTVSFEGKSNKRLQAKQEFDLLRTVQTIVSYADLFEEELNKPREGLEYNLGTGYNYCGFPTYGFSKEGLKVFEEILKIPKKVRDQIGEKYFP